MDDIAKQITSYLYCRELEISIYTESVQQQKNEVDCGLFATSFCNHSIIW